MTDLEDLKRMLADAEAADPSVDPSLYTAFRNALPDLIARVERAEKALKLAAVRMDILCDRMEGCHAETGRHELLDEGRAFASEARSALTGDTPNV